jgi:hypothetical protein
VKGISIIAKRLSKGVDLTPPPADPAIVAAIHALRHVLPRRRRRT